MLILYLSFILFYHHSFSSSLIPAVFRRFSLPLFATSLLLFSFLCFLVLFHFTFFLSIFIVSSFSTFFFIFSFCFPFLVSFIIAIFRLFSSLCFPAPYSPIVPFSFLRYHRLSLSPPTLSYFIFHFLFSSLCLTFITIAFPCFSSSFSFIFPPLHISFLSSLLPLLQRHFTPFPWFSASSPFSRSQLPFIFFLSFSPCSS